MRVCLRRPIAFRALLTLALFGIGFAGAAPAGSLVEVPIEIDLRPWFAAADRQLPREAGHWQTWRDWHGIQTRYRAWRGALGIAMSGDLVHAHAHVRYWAKARKHVIGGLDLSAGCGVDEPPRQALVGLVARLGFAPDWTLRPSFRVLPPRFLDGCEVTVLGIDVSPILGEVFADQLEASLSSAMDGLRPRLDELRGQAERLWVALQVPMEIVPGLWLSATPLGLALAPPLGSGERLHTALGLVLDLRLDTSAPQPQAKRPLPPLQTFLPQGEGFRFDLSLALDYGALGEAIGQALEGRSIEIEGQQIQVAGVSLAPKGDDLVLTAAITGAVPGRLTLMARPGWDAAAGTVRLTDLGYVFDAEDPGQGLGLGLYYERIRTALDRTVNDLLQGRSAQLRDGLQADLAQNLGPALPAGAVLELSRVALRDLAIEVADSGLRLRGTAGGTLKVTVPGGG